MKNEQRRKGSALLHFGDIVGREPFPWQRRFHASLADGRIPEAVDIPTGLGKTSCVLLALLARLENPALPGRIVYVVDRRAIVDQTATAISAWIARIAEIPSLADAFHGMSAFPSVLPVQLGVLRGGLADDGLWRVDPARPAVAVGTVDMIGSRIMFRGYGDGRSRRPMHAGLLGHDSILMLDEAHLSPAMEELVRSIERIQGHPRFRTVTLSATSADAGSAFRLLPEDEADPEVRRRLHACKKPDFHRVGKPAAVTGRMCEAAVAHRSGSVAVFVRTVKNAEKVARNLTERIGPDGPGRVALLTGTLRGKERAELAEGAVWRRFDPGRERGSDGPSVYLVTTSAGEVGVDLDADHAVMDLATLDSTIQRLGRVNRMGLSDSRVAVVFAEQEVKIPEKEPKTPTRKHREAKARAATLAVLSRLPDLSPAALRSLDAADLEECAVSATRPARLHREVVQAYAATSADLRLPDVSVYLRGVSDPDPPECHLVWRRDAPLLVRLGEDAAGEAVAFFRPKAAETARVPASFARKLIEKALGRRNGGGLPLIAVGPRGDVSAETLESEAAVGDVALDHATVFLPADAGGLEASGLPSLSAAGEVPDVGDDEDRIRYVDGAGGPETLDGAPELPAWLDRAIELRARLRDADEEDEEDEEERFLVFALRRPDPALQAGEGGLTWLGASRQTVDEHCSLVGDDARRIGEALALPEAAALETAGRWHDRGKARRVWQRAAGVPSGGPALAKSTGGRLRPELLGGYRHEFGSLAEADRRIPAGAPDRDLVLHLIASHHGWSRPGFPDPHQWDPDTPSALNRRLAVDAEGRFARLQARYGPWRLAWLEALLKAADAHASARGGA